MKTENMMFVVILVLGAVCLLAGSAQAILVDLDELDVGTVVAGEAPNGTIVNAGYFDDFMLTVENHGDGPNSLVVGEVVVLYGHPDWQDQPPAQSDHLMLVADNIIDDRPHDGRIDQPVCEKDGGAVEFAFRSPVNLAYVLLSALDTDNHDYELRVEGEIAVSVSNGSQWDDSGIFIDLEGYVSISNVSVQLRGGIGIARIGYFPESVAAETATWGSVKALYR